MSAMVEKGVQVEDVAVLGLLGKAKTTEELKSILLHVEATIQGMEAAAGGGGGGEGEGGDEGVEKEVKGNERVEKEVKGNELVEKEVKGNELVEKEVNCNELVEKEVKGDKRSSKKRRSKKNKGKVTATGGGASTATDGGEGASTATGGGGSGASTATDGGGSGASTATDGGEGASTATAAVTGTNVSDPGLGRSRRAKKRAQARADAAKIRELVKASKIKMDKALSDNQKRRQRLRLSNILYFRPGVNELGKEDLRRELALCAEFSLLNLAKDEVCDEFTSFLLQTMAGRIKTLFK